MLPNELRQSLERCTQLPSLPSVVLRVIELARDPDVNLNQLITTISSDPALSVRLLSLANTVFYASQRPVEELQQAVNRIGMERTLSLALGCSLVSATGTDATQGLNLERYWQRSLLCALSARSLADSLDLHVDSGALFTASLLQDIGMLALHAVDEARYQPLLEKAPNHEALVALEQTTYATDHAEVGAWLAREWQLSERTAQWIAHSHDALQAVEPEQQAQKCLIASGMLADAWLHGEASMGGAMTQVAKYFGLEASEMVNRIVSLQEQLPAVASLYNIAVPERLDADQLMFEAKMLLAERNARLQQDLLQKQQEIEALRREQEQLNQQARLDSLTKLYNRSYLESTLNGLFAEHQRSGQPFGVIFIDLDRFKRINDDFGHGIGDEVLVAFAKLLRQRVEEYGFYAGRFGGEEFVVLLPGHGSDKAMQFAEGLRSLVGAAPLAYAMDTPLHVTASYGIAALEPGSGFDNVEALVEAADKSMYQSKHAGCDLITVF
ncbi:sensor domain-containing diguanylate cyclase [Litchfieldella xinjiangensis]|uniref:sensor domain-containing diguanylate cyclase n=1 Tax=Litchfieldella xinjiangensis TaxID=1166948 RepID=UPI0005BC1B93|nr:GGDEF domain-containing protein [Halomonas xinjiangensis]